ncbi:MAG: RdgB/HAM1 family non-canonical purine NTP pyrophosphatase [Ferruginibacter sp.]|nr:RdgB/HAM1 family non-canonical purine NTP pyrophosphatase [Ferruginibacter sp.]
MKLIFATNNQNKVAEIKAALTNGLEIITLTEAGINIDIPEPHETLEENAREKATVIHNITAQNCFSEDTGLEVEALAGAPGVLSARYAGDDADNKKNIVLLLSNMHNIENRNAQFKTVISLFLDNKEYQFTGICKGKIINKEIGEMGFGYDAIFVPNGDVKTFAEMSMDEKNKYSHRKKALLQLINFLNQYNGKS